jgi:hypothetical protein
MPGSLGAVLNVTRCRAMIAPRASMIAVALRG